MVTNIPNPSFPAEQEPTGWDEEKRDQTWLENGELVIGTWRLESRSDGGDDLNSRYKSVLAGPPWRDMGHSSTW